MKGTTILAGQAYARPAPSATSASLRLDELTVQDEALRRALKIAPQDTRIAAALLICEAERMSLEKVLML